MKFFIGFGNKKYQCMTVASNVSLQQLCTYLNYGFMPTQNMTDIAPTKKHIREILLHLFFLKKSAAQSRRVLVETYGENILSVTTCRDWFRRFKSEDYKVEDKERSGQPKKFSNDDLRALIKAEPCQTLDELAAVFNVDRSTVGKRLHNMGMVQRAGNWDFKHTIKRVKVEENAQCDGETLSQ